VSVRRIIPIGLLIGAGMEGFMYATGFWKVATKNAAQRAEDSRREREAALTSLERRRSAAPDAAPAPAAPGDNLR
jgi:hypothetical protein